MSSFGSPIQDVDKLEQVQRRPPEELGLEHFFCEERLRDWGLFGLEMRHLQGHLTAAPQYL